MIGVCFDWLGACMEEGQMVRALLSFICQSPACQFCVTIQLRVKVGLTMLSLSLEF